MAGPSPKCPRPHSSTPAAGSPRDRGVPNPENPPAAPQPALSSTRHPVLPGDNHSLPLGQSTSAPELGWLWGRERPDMTHPQPYSIPPTSPSAPSRELPGFPRGTATSLPRTSCPAVRYLGWSRGSPPSPCALHGSGRAPSPHRVPAAGKWGSSFPLCFRGPRWSPASPWPAQSGALVPQAAGVHTGRSPSPGCFSGRGLLRVSGFALELQGGRGSRAGPPRRFSQQLPAHGGCRSLPARACCREGYF